MINQGGQGGVPRARVEGLSVRELDDELLVYDHDTDVAHCLTPVAARVWRLCDGSRDAEELVADDLDPDVVDQTLAELGAKGLLVGPLVAPASTATGISRRHFVRRAAAMTAAVPVILTVAAPMASAQASCTLLQNGAPCTRSDQCCSNNCGGNPKTCKP